MAEIGFISLILALMVSLYSIVAFFIGFKIHRISWITNGRIGVVLVFILVSVSALVLEISLVTHNFQLEYVNSYTSTDLPLPYLISSWWAGNAGSLLFWAWILSLSALIFVLKKQKDNTLLPYSSTITMIVQGFFLIMLIFAINPFTELATIAADGQGLNPLLENPAMIIHPPLLICGYALCTIPFALAIASLLSKKPDDKWIAHARSWMILSWLLLGLGNIIGAWWAYVELGWGGYWGWDPVENTGLMPWLVATAFLHSIIVQRRDGMFKVWTLALIIITFVLTIFGTFLTRSDILSSLHAFDENVLVPYYIAFLSIIFFGSFALLYYRRDELKSNVRLKSPVSKESIQLINILLLLAATLVIFAGTIFPALVEAVGGLKIDIGKSFFNTVTLPVFMIIVFLIGFCTVIGWRKLRNKEFGLNLLVPTILTVGVVIGLLVAGVNKWQAVITFAVCGFVITAILYQWLRELLLHRRTQSEKIKTKNISDFLWANKNRYGAYVIHMAIVLMTIGIVGSSVYASEKEAILNPGESMTINQYTLNYDKMTISDTENKMIVSVSISVYNNEKLVTRLTPEKYVHRNYNQPVTEVAVHSTPIEDLYVILADWDRNQTAAFTVLVNPLIMWIWIGGGVMLLGGLVCFWPQRVIIGPLENHRDNRAMLARLETPKTDE